MVTPLQHKQYSGHLRTITEEDGDQGTPGK